MAKVRYKVTINWQGEVHVYYKHATSAAQALRHGIRDLARACGYSTGYVRQHVLMEEANRWDVKIV